MGIRLPLKKSGDNHHRVLMSSFPLATADAWKYMVDRPLECKLVTNLVATKLHKSEPLLPQMYSGLMVNESMFGR